MPTLLTLHFTNLNTSIQPSDIVYFVPTDTIGTNTSLKQFDTGLYGNITRLGRVLAVDRINNTIDIAWEGSVGGVACEDYAELIKDMQDAALSESALPVDFAEDLKQAAEDCDSGVLPIIGDFILFSKSTPSNTTSLVGYYASANFVNNSNEKVELFSVGSQIAESSR